MKWRIQERDPVRAFFFVECERGVDRGHGVKECARSIWKNPAEGCMWQWDGNLEAPTILPSIDCHGGCGRHFTMIKGNPI